MNPPLTVATPVVNDSEILHIVTLSASQIPDQLKASAERLKVLLDTHAGTYSALHRIAADVSQPLAVRQQSIIQFKNAALPRWKSRKLLSEDERMQIRQRCFQFLTETDDTIASCNELIVAKLARLDYPHNWSSLLSQLLHVVQNGLLSLVNSPDATFQSTLPMRRGLKVLNTIIKDLATMKMLAGIKSMFQATQELRNVLLACYSQLSPIILNISGLLGHERTAVCITIAHIVYKCLMKMALWAWPRIMKDQKRELVELEAWFLELFRSSTFQLEALSQLRINLLLALRTLPISDPITILSVTQLTRHVRVFGKFFRRLQQLDAIKFVELPTCTRVVLYYWSKVEDASQTTQTLPDMIQDSPTAVYPVRFLVQAMVLFKENLARWSPFRKGGPVTETTLSQKSVEDAVRLLVTCFIPLNPLDLEGWMADPEEWVNEEDKDNEQWEYELRPCAERVLMTLAAQYLDYVVPMMEYTFKTMNEEPTTDLASVIRKEALYCAIGRCATKLRDVIPFNEWMRRKLIIEVRETNPTYPIIKRRIAWLIGKWIHDMCIPASDPVVWEILVHLLQDRSPGSDFVVRLTAANAIRECVDTVGFDGDIFSPFLPATVTELMNLMNEADTIEMKQRLAKCLNAVVTCVDSQIVPHIHMIARRIRTLWDTAGDSWLLKAQLLVVVKSLVLSSKEYSGSLAPLIVFLVEESLLTNVAAINLDEDGINLWLTSLRNTTTLQGVDPPNLLSLFPLAMKLLASNLDLLGKITFIIESYFFVDAVSVLQTNSLEFMSAVMSVMRGHALQTNQIGILNCVGFMMQLAQPSLWGEAVHRSGFFSHIVKILGDDESSSAMLTECVFILARIAMANREMFINLVTASAEAGNAHEQSIWEIVMDQFWRQFDHLSEPRHRKLLSLGIASLVSSARPEVLERVPHEIFNIWTDVLYEVRESRNHAEDGEDGGLNLYWDLDSVPASYYAGSKGTLEYNRRKALYEHDPVRTHQLTKVITTALQEAERICGTYMFKLNYLDKTDPAVLKQLETELAG